MTSGTANFVGRPMPRDEAGLKASGAIRYTADIAVPGMLHAVLVPSPIARGRICSIDTTAAEALPGVVRVFTPETMPRLPSVPEPPDWDISYGSSFVPMADNAIQFAGQPIGMVLAETLEVAEHAATLIRYDFAEEYPVVAAGLDEDELDLSGEPFHELEQIWFSLQVVSLAAQLAHRPCRARGPPAGPPRSDARANVHVGWFPRGTAHRCAVWRHARWQACGAGAARRRHWSR
jgi:CO/xanthine dehydrogenase Mo-binding subunit